MKFRYSRISDKRFNRFPIGMLGLSIMIALGIYESEMASLIKGFGIILILSAGGFLVKKFPYQKDKIYVSEKSVTIIKRGNVTIIPAQEIESVTLNSTLFINTADGKTLKLRYSEWLMGTLEIRNLEKSIQEIIMKNTAANNA